MCESFGAVNGAGKIRSATLPYPSKSPDQRARGRKPSVSLGSDIPYRALDRDTSDKVSVTPVTGLDSRESDKIPNGPITQPPRGGSGNQHVVGLMSAGEKHYAK